MGLGLGNNEGKVRKMASNLLNLFLAFSFHFLLLNFFSEANRALVNSGVGMMGKANRLFSIFLFGLSVKGEII